MLIRYPGSKEKLVPQIKKYFPIDISAGLLFISSNGYEYREPFFGAGAIGFDLLKNWPPNSPVWLNDFDYGIVCLWQSVLQAPYDLMEKIQNFTPTVNAYIQYKNGDGNSNLDIVELGFRKLALHQMSYGGMGFMSGGPIGGKDQKNEEYNIRSRWSPPNLIDSIRKAHNILAKLEKLKITKGDFSTVLEGGNENTFVYLDPPYYEKGRELYKYSMDYNEHKRLANILYNANFKWVLSYDDNEVIRNMYNGFYFEEVHAVYTMYGGRRPKNKEVVISNFTVTNANRKYYTIPKVQSLQSTG